MTREQIGMALEYADPRDAIAKIHTRHPERLNQYSMRVPVSRGGQFVPSFAEGTCQVDTPLRSDGGEQETYLYSNKGIMEICRWSKQPKADQFIDFVWEQIIKSQPLTSPYLYGVTQRTQ